ncbi:MAG: YfhO family protein [Lachnospiraceae bacterium]
MLKIGLSGLSFAWYLRKHCKTQDFGIAFFGIFYALSGYMAAYSWNIMWLDCIILFPIIMLGLERLVNEKKCFLYCLALGASILSNYYISIMICIFMVIYFVMLLILKRGASFWDYVVNCFQFGFFSLLSGGLAAVCLLPAIFALRSTASGDFNFPKTFTSYFSIFDMLARHIANVETEIGLDHWPNIYCGVAVLMFFLLYLACRKISVREKAVYCGMLLFFFASFSTNILNFIWHGFHFPNSLPCRQSFIYIFLILVVCYQAYRHLDSIPWKHISLAFFGSVAFVLLAEKLVTEEHFHFVVFYAAIIFLSAYAGLLYLYKKRKAGTVLILFLAWGLVLLESVINMSVTSVTITSRTAYVKDNEDVAALVDTLTPNESFFRVEKVTRKTKNDGAWMNFPSVSLFSSTANADLSAFFKKLGCESSTNAYSITGSTPLVDSLFSVKYALYSEEQTQNPRLTLLDQEGETWLYENPDTLPLGFMIPMDLEDNWQTDLGNPAKVQNDLCEVLGASQALLEVEGTLDGMTYSMTPEYSGEYYVYISNKKVEKVTATIGSESKTFNNTNRGYLLELGYLQAGEEVQIRSETDNQAPEATAYRFSDDGLQGVYDSLDREPLKLTSWTDTVLEGTVKAEEAGILFLSIPYDEGWTITVDGGERIPRKMFDTFLAVDLMEGSHTIRLEYEPQGLKYGAWISAGSAGILLVCWIAAKCMERRKRV